MDNVKILAVVGMSGAGKSVFYRGYYAMGAFAGWRGVWFCAGVAGETGGGGDYGK